MKREKFISLRALIGDTLHHISTMMITCITDFNHFREVHTIGGQKFHVKETADEIMDLIDKSENITFITK